MTALLPYASPIFQKPPLSSTQIIALSLTLIFLLFTLLVEKEFARAYGTRNIRLWLSTISIYSWTLLGVFSFMMLLRFLSFVFD